MTDIDRRNADVGSEPAVESTPSRPDQAVRPQPSWLYGSVPLKVAATIGVAWVAAIAWITAIAPTPDPEATLSTLDVVVQTAMLGSWLAVVVGVFTRQRMVFTASVIGGLILAGAGLLCFATGHTGFWIPAQIGSGVGLAALGYGASRIS